MAEVSVPSLSLAKVDTYMLHEAIKDCVELLQADD
jgi:hypothetical protein